MLTARGMVSKNCRFLKPIEYDKVRRRRSYEFGIIIRCCCHLKVAHDLLREWTMLFYHILNRQYLI